MSTAIKFRGGTTAQHSTFTGAAREITVDTTKNAVVVHDGATAGGIPMAKESALAAKVDTSAIGVSVVGQSGATASAKMPSGTTAQRDGAPALGYLRYNADLSQFEGYGAAGWGQIGGGATGGGNDKVFVENDQTVTTDYSITAGKNAMSAGPITINSGKTVTVPSGSVWTIV